MGLLGPNGAGKSTTLKCLTGMLKPTSGSIFIDGINTEKHHRKSLAHVGCIVETPEFYSDFTPADVIDYIGKYYGLPKREIEIRARDVLEEVRLWDWRHKKIGQFSKGMRQRVSLAQALLPNPDLILLDEPTSGLDPRGMIEMREILNNLKNGKRSLLISTHILKEVSEVCDYVTMINHGTAVISGEVKSLVSKTIRDGGKTFTLEFRTLREIPERLVTDINGCEGVEETVPRDGRNFSVSFSGSEEAQAALVDLIYGYNVGLLSVAEKGADLESLYMELTKNDEVNIK